MLLNNLERIKRIDQLIRLKNTGNAEEFAKKLNVSRKHVYNLIEELKNLGLDIVYNRNLQSFVYEKPYKVKVSLEIIELSEVESEIINGGALIEQLFLCNFITQKANNFVHSK